MIISREADVLKAGLQDSSKILAISEIEIFKTFEVQLRTLERAGCTTVDTCVLR